jgi:hypothetical protein
MEQGHDVEFGSRATLELIVLISSAVLNFTMANEREPARQLQLASSLNEVCLK